jgi:tripartite-type tricarboxylate transporter receptor subunit TctC
VVPIRWRRLLARVITAHGLLKQPLQVVNKSGGAGAEAFLHLRASAGNPHKLLMALSNLFTTPFASGIPFNYRDLTPVGMLALDQFVLWVNSAAPYATAREYLDAIKAAPDKHFSWRHRGETRRPAAHGRASTAAGQAAVLRLVFEGVVKWRPSSLKAT